MDPEANFNDCLSRVICHTCLENDHSGNIDTSFVGESSLFWWKMRRVAISKGLAFIYDVSKNDEVFNTFGSDIIQCFYDISKVWSC